MQEESFQRRKDFSRLTNSAGKHIPLLERVLELRHADPFFVHDVLGWATGEEAREAVVEVDQILCDAAALGLIRLQNGAV